MTVSSRRSELAAFCSDLPRMRTAAEHAGLADLLTSVIAEVKGGADVSAQLLRLGIPTSGAPRDTGYAAVLAATGSGHFYDPVYACPTDACLRRERREPGGPIPHCELFGQPLRPAR